MSILVIGLVRLFLAFVALLMLHLIGAEMLGFELLSLPFLSVSVLSVALSLLATAGRPEDASEAPTQDERKSWGPGPEYGSAERGL